MCYRRHVLSSACAIVLGAAGVRRGFGTARRHRVLMNQAVRPQKIQKIAASACPHDCPSTCALEVEVFDAHTIGRVRGAADNAYTAGVICAKVARYAERVASSRPADAAAAPHRRQGLRPVRADLLGRRARSCRRSISCAPKRSTARKRSGRITMPAPWATSCATASIACATPRNIPASSRPSASIRP